MVRIRPPLFLKSAMVFSLADVMVPDGTKVQAKCQYCRRYCTKKMLPVKVERDFFGFLKFLAQKLRFLVSDEFRQNRIFPDLRFYPNDAEETPRPGNGDVHPFFVQIRYQSDVGNDHGGPLKALEPEKGVTDDM